MTVHYPYGAFKYDSFVKVPGRPCYCNSVFLSLPSCGPLDDASTFASCRIEAW